MQLFFDNFSLEMSHVYLGKSIIFAILMFSRYMDLYDFIQALLFLELRGKILR
jgi:hypothetical protein